MAQCNVMKLTTDFTRTVNLLHPEAVTTLERAVAEQRRFIDALRTQREAVDAKIAWRQERLAKFDGLLERARAIVATDAARKAAR
jgi:hypothetical protein